MQKNTRRAVIIKNPSSPYISEAIVFLRENSHIKEEKVIVEAERIISDYLKGNQFMSDMNYVNHDDDICLYTKGSIKPQKKKTHKRHYAVMMSIITAVIALCIFGIYHSISS